MISGFNTDIEFGGTVYHIQTEDKGLSARLIISLVYDGGTILASKRVSYDDLAASNFDEKKLADRVGRQHKLICAAVRAGRIDELKGMSAKSAAKTKTKAEPAGSAIEEPAYVAAPTIVTPVSTGNSTEQLRPAPPPFVPKFDPPPVSPPKPPAERVSPDPFADAPVIEAVDIIEDEVIMPAEAVAVVSELSGRERPQNSRLSLELLGDLKFKGGDRRTVNIMVCRGTDRKVVVGAQIMIKVLGSSFRPVIFHARSDANGLAKMHLQLPQFRAGRAALLVRAMSDGEEIELRRVVTPG